MLHCSGENECHRTWKRGYQWTSGEDYHLKRDGMNSQRSWKSGRGDSPSSAHDGLSFQRMNPGTYQPTEKTYETFGSSGWVLQEWTVPQAELQDLYLTNHLADEDVSLVDSPQMRKEEKGVNHLQFSKI